MTEINIMAEQKDEQKFADVLLFLVPIEGFVAFELAANVGQLFVDAFDFGLFAFACKKKTKIIKRIILSLILRYTINK